MIPPTCDRLQPINNLFWCFRVLSCQSSAKILRRHYELQNEERKKAGKSWIEYGLIFTSANGTPIHFRNLLRDYKNLLKVAGCLKSAFTICVIQRLR